jgi:hypothetical protein
MLDAYIIDDIRERERKSDHARPQIHMPARGEEWEPHDSPAVEEDDRGPVIIPLRPDPEDAAA